MKLSIICPTYNEIGFVDALIQQLCANDGIDKEVLITDGGSKDGTREQVMKWMESYPNLRLIDNPKQTSTHAFNAAYKISKGEYIAFVGAHATYDANYFKEAVSYLDRKECEVVGGPLHQQGKTKVGKAIALVMSSKMGVGNTEFRTGKSKMYVDSVAFAVYKRDVFEKAGLMNESLPVNQDDELHYRLNNLGFRVLMVPEMKATYYVRDSFKKLFLQYFKYGLYKPLVLQNLKGAIRLRHLVPSFFVMYMLSLPLVCWFPLWIIPLLLYCLLSLFVVIRFKTDWMTRIICLPVFPILHIAYGTGFLLGLTKTI
jgi:cellulose synthase/poly-beta-1,6-N-acetylglucosamine synthase-like glycosyltransferase